MKSILVLPILAAAMPAFFGKVARKADYREGPPMVPYAQYREGPPMVPYVNYREGPPMVPYVDYRERLPTFDNSYNEQVNELDDIVIDKNDATGFLKGDANQME